MTTDIRVDSGPGERRVAVIRDGGLLDYAVSRPGRPDGMGDLWRGRVTALVPGMAGAFVSLGDHDGFLPDSAGAAGQHEGAAVRVRVTRAAQGGKGPRLVIDGRAEPGPPALLARGPDAVERLAAWYPDAPVTLDDPALVPALRPTLGPRLQTGKGFDPEIAALIDALGEPSVDLPGGLRATITPTPALIAIDVDAAAATADRRAKAAAQFAMNRAMLPALMAQIRLRNLSGAILIDLAGLTLKKRAALGPDILAALAADRLGPRFLGFTALGLMEISRPRAHPPLHELLAGPHAAGLRALRAIMRASAADPAAWFALRAAPDVCAALADDPVAVPDLARRTGRPLMIHSDPTLPPGQFSMERMSRG